MNKSQPTDFKDRLREAREMRSLNQAELAEKAGLPASSISHFEAGSRKPSFDNLRRLAGVLNVTTDFLLGRVNSPNQAAEADPLYRDIQNLSEQDRDLTRDFLKMLADRDKAKRK